MATIDYRALFRDLAGESADAGPAQFPGTSPSAASREAVSEHFRPARRNEKGVLLGRR
ncbi:MAG TPA: hypothetical protein VHJ18_09150 [Streptosporangiaceae bacterium]|nr:hypothetical protein [Streptosporangiaceae bacterium]